MQIQQILGDVPKRNEQEHGVSEESGSAQDRNEHVKIKMMSSKWAITIFSQWYSRAQIQTTATTQIITLLIIPAIIIITMDALIVIIIPIATDGEVEEQ